MIAGVQQSAANYDMGTEGERSGSHLRFVYSTLGGGKVAYKPMKSLQKQEGDEAGINPTT